MQGSCGLCLLVEASAGEIAEAFFRYPLGLTHAEAGNAAITESLFRYSAGIFSSPENSGSWLPL
jgi:hypothetical protein